jgi:hypothetical protein
MHKQKVNGKKKMQEQIAAELARIPALGAMLKGSVSEIRRGPRKRGTGERASYLLTFKGKHNKTRSVYVPAERVKEVRELIATHREAVRTIEKVVEISIELFKAQK